MYAVTRSFFVKIDQLTTDLSAQVVSTLSVLEPVRRAPVGIPFLYQKVRSGNFLYFGGDLKNN